MAHSPALLVRHLGLVDYASTLAAMQHFTASRTPDTPDELWLLQHPAVFTLGQAGKREHLVTDIGIPVIPIDRGGQITHHGPGQIVVYLLLDLKRRGYGVRELVSRIEQAIIDLLADIGIAAQRRAGAPGVYANDAKIAALGLRVKQGCTYHGMALNVDMDLRPFHAINPCGYAGMAVTQIRHFVPNCNIDSVGEALLLHLQQQL